MLLIPIEGLWRRVLNKALNAAGYQGVLRLFRVHHPILS